mgnify:FL=1
MASRKSNTDNTSKPSTATIGYEAKLVDCMVALPGQRFYTTQIPVCLWFSGKIEPAEICRALTGLELALAA